MMTVTACFLHARTIILSVSVLDGTAFLSGMIM